jgi:hypothetical protein
MTIQLYWAALDAVIPSVCRSTYMTDRKKAELRGPVRTCIEEPFIPEPNAVVRSHPASHTNTLLTESFSPVMPRMTAQSGSRHRYTMLSVVSPKSSRANWGARLGVAAHLR